MKGEVEVGRGNGERKCREREKKNPETREERERERKRTVTLVGGRCEDSAALRLQSEPNFSSPAPSRTEIAIATYMHVFESITGLKY